MTRIRVLVADDHPLVIKGLPDVLAPFGIDVVAAISGAAEVLTRYKELRPDVVVLDVRLGPARGLEVVQQLLKMDSKARVVVYSHFDQDHVVREAYRVGAKAFLPKNAEIEVLAEAISAARNSSTYFLPSIAERLALMSVRGDEPPQAVLSERELTVFKLMAEGLTNIEIAEKLSLTQKTIGVIAQAVRDKLKVSRQADLTKLAIRHQLIDE